MRKILFSLILVAVMACGSDRSRETIKFRNLPENILEIATLEKLTDDGRSIYPNFGPGDTIVFYQRLLLTDLADTFAYFPEEIIKPYGVSIKNGELYTLEGKPKFPSTREIDVSRLPQIVGEETVWGVRSLDSSIIAFETIPAKNKEKTHFIYLSEGDSVRQLTYGDVPCFVERFSNTGRYLTAVYNTGPTWLLIFDLKNNHIYKIERPESDGDIADYLTSFSSDDSMMLFIRSKKEYLWGNDYFGDIWLLKFKK
jgi:hypothetical protein